MVAGQNPEDKPKLHASVTWLVRVVALSLIAVGAALTPTPGHTQSLRTEVTFVGPVVSGGAVSITMNREMTAIRRFELFQARIDTQCGTASVSITVYLDPPRQLEGDEFATGANTPDTPNSTTRYWLAGSIDDDGQLFGTVGMSSLACKLRRPSTWTASGPVGEPPGASDLMFANDAGNVVITTDRAGEHLTSMKLEGIDLSPCSKSDSIQAFFQPAAPFATTRDFSDFRFLQVDENGRSNGVWVEVTNADTGSLNFYVVMGGIGCAADHSWLLHPVPDSEKDAPSVQPLQLPSAGVGVRDRSAATAALVAVLGIFMLLAGAAFARGRSPWRSNRSANDTT